MTASGRARSRREAHRRSGHHSLALVDRLREQGVRSIVAAPIVVSGALWGAVMLSTNDDRTFSADAEARIAQFTNLVAVALANAEAHEQLSTLAEEQAALSRVAVAVATEEQRDRLFNIATEEIGRLFGARAAAIVRFLDDPDEAELVGAWDPSDSPVRSARACRTEAGRPRW